MSPPPKPLMLGVYATATRLLEPMAGGLLRRRAARGKEDPERLGERLGRTRLARANGPLVWLHGVSVGESVSLLPLVDALRSRRPDLNLLVTSGTRTAAELLARRLPAGVIHQYAPVDGPNAVAAFLDHWRPDAGLFVESELWPNLILGARERGVRLALISARMTQASANRWARTPGAAAALLTAFDLILPQESATEVRLLGLGAQVGPHLNLKLAGGPLPCNPRALAGIRTAVAGRKVVVAASTHPGEEALIAAAFREATADGPPALLVIVPRHPERGAAVAGDLIAAGLSTTRRSTGAEPDAETQAYVADTLGELGLFFRIADAVVMGGSFVPDIGGHNPLEPARLGRAIVTGPHVFNAAEVYAEMFAEVAAIEAADGAALARHLRGLLTQPLIARRIGEAGLTYAEGQGEAFDRALALLAPLLPAPLLPA